MPKLLACDGDQVSRVKQQVPDAPGVSGKCADVSR